MRFAVFVVCLLLIQFGVNAQETASWKVTLNKKTILNGTDTEDTVKNRLLIKREDLSNNGSFKVEYTEAKNSETKGWVRTMAVYDTTSTMMAQMDSTHVLLFYNKDILKLLWSRKKVIVYTWAAPADKAMAAAIRIRRLRLCTLEMAE